MFKKILASLLSLAVLLAGFPSYAGYAQLTPPSGWSQGLSAAIPGQAGVFAYGAAANASTFKGTTVLTNASLAVAGQLVTVPVSMRVAANAATTAAEYSFGNPYLFTALIAAPIAYKWFKDSGFMVKDGIWQKSSLSACTGGVCLDYRFGAGEQYAGDWATSITMAAADWAGKNAFTPNNWQTSGFAKIGYTVGACTATGCLFEKTSTTYGQTPVVTNISKTAATRTGTAQAEVWSPVLKPEFIERMNPQNIPDGMPKELPNLPLPVLPPVFNPDPAINPLPSPSALPVARPLWVPTGDPVKNPNPSPSTNPDTWTQPGQRVTASPTTSDPWRVDVIDDPKTSTSSAPNTAPVTTPAPSTPTTPTDFTTCGLPGKPKCLIDETGTAADKGASFDPSKTELDVAKDAAKSAIDAASAIQTPNWSFIFQFPTGCTPIVTTIRGFVLDPCKFQAPVHSLMSMLWAASTVFAMISMVGRTIRES